MKNIAITLAAASVLAFAPAAYAGKGGSAAKIRTAVASGSVDAIIAEVERTESLICDECVDLVTALTEDARYPVREVAGWWFARRPALADMLASQFLAELPTGDTAKVRNGADFLGAIRAYSALPQLRSAISRSDIGAEARVAIVRAAGALAHTGVNDLLATAMADADPSVRAAAVAAWRDVRWQAAAQPVVALLRDSDSHVRAQAAAAVGGLVEQSGRAQLEVLVVGDPDPVVRRNAAWALGQLGNAGSRAALVQATSDHSGLVSGVAKSSLARLH